MGTFNPVLPSGATAGGTTPSYTSVSGVRATDSVGASAAIREVQKAMIIQEPFQTPMLTWMLSNKLGKKGTGNPKFEWIYSSLLPRNDTVTLAGGAASEDNITVGDSTLYQVGTKFVVDATGEVLVVDSIASSQIDVTRIGTGNITAGTSTTVTFMGDVFEQGSASATAKSVNKNFEYNYVEIFKKAVHANESQKSNVEYGDTDWDMQKLMRMKEFKLDLEENLLHGVRDTDTTGLQNATNIQYYSGGIFDTAAAFIYTYYNHAGDTPSEAFFFNTFLKGLFSRGSNRKRLYAGANLVQAINDYSKVKQQTKVSEKEYGVDIQRILCPFGMLELVWHPMLRGSVFGSYGIALDMGISNLKYRFKSGNGINRDVQYRDYVQFEEQDSQKGEWIGEIGWQIEGNEEHGIIKPQ